MTHSRTAANTELLVVDPAVPAQRGVGIELMGADSDSWDGPRLLWAAPGSLGVDRVRTAWERRGRLSDLGQVAGPWAVALWDPSAGYVLAPDPVGVMPLYWARASDGRIAAASWLAQLVDRDDVDDSLDYEGILLDEGLGFDHESVLHRTRFAAVSRVPWGRALKISQDGRTSLQQYWDPHSLPCPDESLTLEDSAELLRERIDVAVRRLTPRDAVVGAHVSGGLDCTSVACRADQVLRESGSRLVAGYSWAPSEELVPRLEEDERALLDDVTTAQGFPIRRIVTDESARWFGQRDPNRYGQSTHFRERWTLPQAEADGVQVMLSGWGGDELASFNGRAVTTAHFRRGRLDRVWRQSSQRVEVTTGSRAGLRRRGRAFAGALMEVLPDRVVDLRDRDRARAEAELESQIDAQIRAFSPLSADLRRERAELFAAARDHHSYQLQLLTNGHLQHRTGWWYQTGRLFDLQYRYPLLDLGVVTAALSLPWEAFRSNGWTRVGFRHAVAPWVPASVAWNVTKNEPSLFGPRGGESALPRVAGKSESPSAAPRPVPPEVRRLRSDEQLVRVMRLADSTYRRVDRS